MKPKKLLVLLITLLFTISMCTTAYGSSYEDQHIISRENTYLSDGTRIETIIYKSNIGTYGSNTTTGTKRATYYSANDEALWYVSVTGTFTYSGHSSLCTGASVGAGSYVSNWKIKDKSSTYSGNSATGTATGRFYVGITPIQDSTLSVILYCDIDGNFS